MGGHQTIQTFDQIAPCVVNPLSAPLQGSVSTQQAETVLLKENGLPLAQIERDYVHARQGRRGEDLKNKG